MISPYRRTSSDAAGRRGHRPGHGVAWKASTGPLLIPHRRRLRRQGPGRAGGFRAGRCVRRGDLPGQPPGGQRDRRDNGQRSGLAQSAQDRCPPTAGTRAARTVTVPEPTTLYTMFHHGMSPHRDATVDRGCSRRCAAHPEDLDVFGAGGRFCCYRRESSDGPSPRLTMPRPRHAPVRRVRPPAHTRAAWPDGGTDPAFAPVDESRSDRGVWDLVLSVQWDRGTVAQVTERPTDHNDRAQLVARNHTNHQDRLSTQTNQTARIQRRTIASHATRMCGTDRHPGCPRGASQVAFLATGTVLRDLAAPRGRGCGRQVPEEATWPRPTTATA